jgi:hypothetical protein
MATAARRVYRGHPQPRLPFQSHHPLVAAVAKPFLTTGAKESDRIDANKLARLGGWIRSRGTRFSIAVEKAPGSDGAGGLVALGCWGHAMPDRVTTITPHLLLASGTFRCRKRAISALTLCVKRQKCMGEA